jgi:hypothetical protein
MLTYALRAYVKILQYRNHAFNVARNLMLER